MADEAQRRHHVEIDDIGGKDRHQLVDVLVSAGLDASLEQGFDLGLGTRHASLLGVRSLKHLKTHFVAKRFPRLTPPRCAIMPAHSPFYVELAPEIECYLVHTTYDDERVHCSPR